VDLLAVEVNLLGVEGIPGSCEAEDEEASPTEGELWKEAAKMVVDGDEDSSLPAGLNQATTAGCKKEVRLAW